jgi:hypothetical protein
VLKNIFSRQFLVFSLGVALGIAGPLMYRHIIRAGIPRDYLSIYEENKSLFHDYITNEGSTSPEVVKSERRNRIQGALQEKGVDTIRSEADCILFQLRTFVSDPNAMIGHVNSIQDLGQIPRELKVGCISRFQALDDGWFYLVQCR